MARELAADDRATFPPDLEWPARQASLLAFRVLLLLNGVIFPLLCFVSAAWGMPTSSNEPWQSGRVDHYVAMLLGWPGFAPFLPLVVFSQVGLMAWLIKRSTASWIVVQLGIYGGALLSLQFLVFVLLTSGLVSPIAAIFMYPFMVAFVRSAVYLPRYVHRFTIRHLLILTTVMALVIAGIRVIGGPIDPLLWLDALVATLLLIWEVIAIATPTLCVVTYVRASIQVSKITPSLSPRSMLSALAWLMAWAVSWKTAVDIMLDEYSKLPASNPNCYVASAAAHGHQWLVRRQANASLNLQMRRLKFLELALAAASPRCHQAIRAGYDRLGPLLARRCQRTIWFADAAYLLLKPLECLSELIRIIARIRRSTIEGIYQVRHPSSRSVRPIDRGESG